jgi:hypothetical protein
VFDDGVEVEVEVRELVLLFTVPLCEELRDGVALVVVVVRPLFDGVAVVPVRPLFVVAAERV